MMTKKELQDSKQGDRVWVIPASLWSSSKNSKEETLAISPKGDIIDVLFPVPCEVIESFTVCFSLNNLMTGENMIASNLHVFSSHMKCLKEMQSLISKR